MTHGKKKNNQMKAFTIFKLTATDLFLTVLAQKFLNEIDFSEALLHG